MKLKLATIALILASTCLTASAATNPVKKLCVNGSSQVFARFTCLAAETPFVASTPTPTPTPAATAGLLNLNTCRKVSSSASSNVGVATAGFQCDLSKEFVLEYGFTTSDGTRTDAVVRREEITYGVGGNLPAGVSVTMEGSRTRFYNLNLTATCCKR